MTVTYDQRSFHTLVLVLCRGSSDREEYNRVIDLVFENMSDNQRNYYWESYNELKGVATIINLLENIDVNIAVTPNESQSIDKSPDNVVPIKP